MKGEENDATLAHEAENGQVSLKNVNGKQFAKLGVAPWSPQTSMVLQAWALTAAALRSLVIAPNFRRLLPPYCRSAFPLQKSKTPEC
jgi:hypothetical protein